MAAFAVGCGGCAATHTGQGGRDLDAVLSPPAMTALQVAIVSSAQDWATAQTVGRPEKGQAVDHLATVEQRAAESGASVRTQKMADKVVKGISQL